MITRAIPILVFLLLGICGCVENFQLDKTSTEAAFDSQDKIYTNIKRALISTGLSARIYAQQGSCRVGYYGYLPLPQISIRPLADEQKGVEAIRYMFDGNSDVVISEDSGIVRIYIGKISTELLDTQIGSLTYSEFAQYNPQPPEGSIDTIMNAPEVRATMMKLRIKEIGGAFVLGISPAIETEPHLPADAGSLTVDQALDGVAKTFGSIVSYEECRKSNGYGFVDVGLSWIPKK